ncbi:hypothetical protein LHYA1_G006776 [Lachnellula hyalina]|uniref:Uncharacterized protein n=1 Tax=Lachnellula hyalina TaxID=1316788 RepID=A0A8H8QW70_9HELO|nr:uncharacterized protein LHYA1_G006776 [Lachnellula hyalina]TVY23808.1 hypothetical protein LHYA1_G006776 [Lachnellula hyalina]
MSVPARLQKIRRIVWTGAIAGVTATGAWYGAGLKIQRDAKRDVQKRYEATPAEKIAQLEEQRGGLVAKRIGLEKKIQELELRAQGKTWAESREGKERKR